LFTQAAPDGTIIKSRAAWLPANGGFYDNFRAWLKAGGYGESALDLYSVAARLALGLLDKPYWQIDAEADLNRVRAYLAAHYDSQATRATYEKGLKKLAQYLCLRNRQPVSPKPVNWAYYCAGLPGWLEEHLRDYLAHCRRAWLPEQHYQATIATLSHLTLSLRWLAGRTPLTSLADITPNLWFEYVDMRLAKEIKATTLNTELAHLQPFLQFMAAAGQPICARMLRVEPLTAPQNLPRDVPPEQLRKLQAEIERDAAAGHAGLRRLGLTDKVWFLLMLHSGLRTGEVRRLRQSDLDLTNRRVWIEQSKGLKDRVVYLSQLTAEAIRAYLVVRGPANSDHLFLFRHQPLSVTYCRERLETYGQRCGVRVTPHQLRHSCATLLLNAGAPILAVQTILGHKHIDTTLGYARLYDGTIANDFYRAMTNIESRFDSGKTSPAAVVPGHLLAMVDALQAGTLNPAQQETVQTLRAALVALAEQPG